MRRCIRACFLLPAFLLTLAACAPVTRPAPIVTTNQPRRSGCREDIPDCVAACALRETARTDFVEWFDQRCAAVILGRNPDHVSGTTPPKEADLLDTR